MPEAPYRRTSAQPLPEYPARSFAWSWFKPRLRSKWGIALAVVVGLVGLQVGWWMIQGPGVTVEIVNESRNPLNEVVVSADSWENIRSRIEPGGRTRMRVKVYGEVPLRLSYQDTSGRPQTLLFESFEPRFLRSEGRKFVIVLADDGLYRYSEDNGGWSNRLKRAFERSLWMFR